MSIEDVDHGRYAELVAKLGRPATPADFASQPAPPEPVADEPAAEEPQATPAPKRRGRPPRRPEGEQE